MTRPARAVRRDRPAWQRDPMAWMIIGLVLGAALVAAGATLGIHLHVQAERATPRPAATITVTPPAGTPAGSTPPTYTGAGFSPSPSRKG